MEILNNKEHAMKWFDNVHDEYNNLKKKYELQVSELNDQIKKLDDFNQKLTFESKEKDNRLLSKDKNIQELEDKYSQLEKNISEEENSNNRVCMLKAKDREICNLQKEKDTLQKEKDMWIKKYKLLEDKIKINESITEEIKEQDEVKEDEVKQDEVKEDEVKEDEEVNDDSEVKEVDENNDLTIFMYNNKKYCISTDDIKTKGDKLMDYHEYSNYECGKKVSKLKFIHWAKQKVNVVVITDPDDKEKYIYKHDKEKVLSDKLGYYDINPKNGKKNVMKLYE